MFNLNYKGNERFHANNFFSLCDGVSSCERKSDRKVASNNCMCHHFCIRISIFLHTFFLKFWTFKWISLNQIVDNELNYIELTDYRFNEWKKVAKKCEACAHNNNFWIVSKIERLKKIEWLKMLNCEANWFEFKRF